MAPKSISKLPAPSPLWQVAYPLLLASCLLMLSSFPLLAPCLLILALSSWLPLPAGLLPAPCCVFLLFYFYSLPPLLGPCFLLVAPCSLLVARCSLLLAPCYSPASAACLYSSLPPCVLSSFPPLPP